MATSWKGRFACAVFASIAARDGQAVSEPDIVYMNRCASTCSVISGTDDAVNGLSSVVSGSTTVAAFPFADSVFDATAACVRSVLAPYNVEVRVTSPGAAPRREILLTGSNSQLVVSFANLPAISPFDGAPEDNTIAFVFANSVGSNVDNLCWVTATEIGHLYGLDSVAPCSDIMSLATGCGVKDFTDQDAACSGAASGTPGQCLLGNTTQNSAAMLSATPGPTDILFQNGLEAFQLPASGPAP